MKEGKEWKDARTSRCVEARGCLQQRTMRAALLSVDCEEAEWRRPNPCRREEAHATHPKVNFLIRKLNSHAAFKLMMPPLIFHRSSPRLPRAHYHQFRSTFNLRHAAVPCTSDQLLTPLIFGLEDVHLLNMIYMRMYKLPLKLFTSTRQSKE